MCCDVMRGCGCRDHWRCSVWCTHTYTHVHVYWSQHWSQLNIGVATSSRDTCDAVPITFTFLWAQIINLVSSSFWWFFKKTSLTQLHIPPPVTFVFWKYLEIQIKGGSRTVLLSSLCSLLIHGECLITDCGVPILCPELQNFTKIPRSPTQMIPPLMSSWLSSAISRIM